MKGHTMSKKTAPKSTKPAKEKAPALDTASGVVVVDGVEYKVKGHATLPTFKIAENVPTLVMFDGDIIAKEKRDKEGPILDDKGNPAVVHVVKVVMVKTGEVGQIVCGAVLVRALKDYAGGYVGKTFLLTKHPGETGKAKQWTVVEVAI